MIGLENRQALARDIDAAHYAGARLKSACETADIELRTLQRWKAFEGPVSGDGRPQAVRPTPSHVLSEAERVQVLAVANEPRFAAVPPARIVPILVDGHIYFATVGVPRRPKLSGRPPHTSPLRLRSVLSTVLYDNACRPGVIG
jgi:hypothetical protein